MSRDLHSRRIVLSPSLQDHFLRPRHAGAPPAESFSGSGENQVCGDRVVIGLALDRAGAARAYFQARGCSASIACASLVADALHGAPLDVARSLDVAALVERAGGLPPAKRHAVEVVTRALARAVEAAEQARRDEQRSEPEAKPSPQPCSDS